MVTVLAVRHADVDRTAPGDDPGLSPAGRERAVALVHVAGAAGVATVVTSTRRRTRETGAPLVAALGVPTLEEDTPADLAAELRAGTHGRVVVIVGHTNTLPALATALGTATAPVVADPAFDDLFVIVTTGARTAALTPLRYGSAG